MISTCCRRRCVHTQHVRWIFRTSFRSGPTNARQYVLGRVRMYKIRVRQCTRLEISVARLKDRKTFPTWRHSQQCTVLRRDHVCGWLLVSSGASTTRFILRVSKQFVCAQQTTQLDDPSTENVGHSLHEGCSGGAGNVTGDLYERLRCTRKTCNGQRLRFAK